MDRDQTRFAHIRLSRLSSCCFPQPYKVQVHPASKSLRRSCPDLTSLFLLPFQVPASTSPTISDPPFPAACRQDNHRRNKYSPTSLQLCSQVFLSGASKIPLSACALLHPSFATEPPTHLFDISILLLEHCIANSPYRLLSTIHYYPPTWITTSV
ncbi:hypothetical protein CABS03_03222 [Colletotrichum abscissum]|uniref:Uncharacterized protein n=1 Tax=Colletotrichum abscissum TaxID=1671311 RepID=A0A9P9XAI8_9PEZI|nr:hypothetical protein CABS02_10111 [Colletotrichum abscissum]